MSDTGGTIESLSSTTLTPIERWVEEIRMSELELKKFHERGRMVTRRFLDERDALMSGNKWFNLYYANTGIMESALYAQLPKPAVTRRFKDYEDDVARVAALIIQRSITQDLDDPRDTFDSTMRAAVQDRLIPGLSMAWLRLETDTEDIESPEGETTEIEGEEPQGPMKSITDQRVCVDYVFWQDFLWSPCRVWEERRWTGRKVYMTRDELVERFGEELGNKVPLDHTATTYNRNVQGMTPQYEAIKKARVYEIWDRESRKVFWISKSHPKILDEKDDPLRLVGFEPHPRPMLANVTTSNTTPRPDFYMIQDQYIELDVVNNRISLLIQACKVVGVYDQSAVGISRMLTEGFDNQLIPVDNWAMFAEKNGLKGQIDWLPLESVVASLTQLNDARERIKGQIYELTGISDIVRGATKASETLGAQEIKSKFASIAIKKRQDEVARFAADILRIKAEIMIKHFSPEMLLTKSNILATGEGNVQYVEQALQMLQTEAGFEWRIQITADSIAQADYAMEKADRIELLTAVSSYLEKAGAMFQMVPGSAPLLVGMLKWAVAGFRNASEIEGLLDKELDALEKAPAPEEKPDPEVQKAEMEMQTAQQKAQLDMESKQADMQMKERMNAMEIQMKQMELQFKERELDLQAQKMQMEMDYAGAEAAMKQRTSIEEQRMSLDAQAQQHEQKLTQAKEVAASKPKPEKVQK